MKPLLIISIAITVAFSACESSSVPAPETKQPVEVKNDSHGKDQSTLALNNGEKWKADESTNANVASLEKALDRFYNMGEKKLEDYKTLQTSLQAGIEKMVKECRMKGADHDALHLWLEPLMKMVRDLGKVKSEEQSAAALETINRQIKMYPQYFQ